MSRFVFTSESVTEGHPDKIADAVSDGVLDAVMAQDPVGRVACETFITTGVVIVGGEITTETYVDIPNLVREIVSEIGYTDARMGFDCHTCAVLTTLDRQSPDIALGVDSGGAGDQGMMFGYATRETDELMPLPIMLAHKLTRRLAEVRKAGTLPYLRPDGKSQVSVTYDNGVPVSVDTVVLSTQHDEDVDIETLRKEIRQQVITPVLPATLVNPNGVTYHINPTGRFVVGGPHGDTGLTGRKIIVDTYGGFCPHGGGAFSGKDPSKVDRSATYAARWIAKNLVAAGLARRCQIQIAYAIGVAEPVSVMVDAMGTSDHSDQDLTALVRKHFDLRPAAIIEQLQLRRPIYRATAAYGHFGRSEPTFTWEQTNRVSDLQG